MSNILVHQSQEQDASIIHDLVRGIPPLTRHTPYTYWNLFKNFGDSCFIATDQEIPVGFITSHPTTTPSNEWFIWQAGILPEYRGTGLIDELQDRVIDVARGYGSVALTTTIEADNLRSFGAFSRMASRLGATMEETGRLSMAPDNELNLEEIIYRISLQG